MYVLFTNFFFFCVHPPTKLKKSPHFVWPRGSTNTPNNTVITIQMASYRRLLVLTLSLHWCFWAETSTIRRSCFDVRRAQQRRTRNKNRLAKRKKKKGEARHNKSSRSGLQAIIQKKAKVKKTVSINNNTPLRTGISKKHGKQQEQVQEQQPQRDD